MCWLLSLAHNTPFTEYRVHKRDIPRRYVYLLMQFNFLFIFIPFFLQIVFLRSSILTSETSGRQRRRKKLKNSETEACLCCEWNDNKNVNGAQLCVSSAFGLDSRRPLSVFTFFFFTKVAHAWPDAITFGITDVNTLSACRRRRRHRRRYIYA